MKFQHYIFFVTLTILIESVYNSDYPSPNIMNEIASDSEGKKKYIYN